MTNDPPGNLPDLVRQVTIYFNMAPMTIGIISQDLGQTVDLSSEISSSCAFVHVVIVESFFWALCNCFWHIFEFCLYALHLFLVHWLFFLCLIIWLGAEVFVLGTLVIFGALYYSGILCVCALVLFWAMKYLSGCFTNCFWHFGIFVCIGTVLGAEVFNCLGTFVFCLWPVVFVCA